MFFIKVTTDVSTLSFPWQNTQQNFKCWTQNFLMKFGGWYIIYEEQEVPNWPWHMSAVCFSAIDSVRAEASGT